MKVVVVASLGSSLYNFRGELLRRLISSGHEVFALAPSFDQTTLKFLSGIGVRSQTYPLSRTGRNPFQDFRSIEALKSCFQELQPDVVIAYTVKAVVYSGRALESFPKIAFYPLITGLGHAFQNSTIGQRLVGLIARALYRRALRRATLVFFQNTDDFALFRKIGLLGKDKPTSVLAGSGVDLERFQFAPLPGGPITFLMIARLIHEKGVDEFVSAARIVKRSFTGAKFQLLGAFENRPGSLGPAQINEWVNEGVIEYIPEKQDVRPFLAGAHVFVLPSYREGMPRTVLEAMATGRPTITTDVPGCRQSIVHGQSGFLVPVKEVIPLADTMKLFLNNPQLIEEMGCAARKRCELVFDVNLVNDQMMSQMGL